MKLFVSIWCLCLGMLGQQLFAQPNTVFHEKFHLNANNAADVTRMRSLGVSTVSEGNKTVFSRAGSRLLHVSDFIPVDTDALYILSGTFRSAGEGLSKLYYGFDTYDVNMKQITSLIVLTYGNAVTITNVSDNSITVTEPIVGWQGRYAHSRSLGFYYDGITGALPSAVFERLPSFSNSTLPGDGAYSQASGNTISLNAVLPSEILSNIVSGTTKVMNHSRGGTYLYTAASGAMVPTEERYYEGRIQYAQMGNKPTKFRPGTKYVRVVVLPNYQQTNTFRTTFDKLEMIEPLNCDGNIVIPDGDDREGKTCQANRAPVASNGAIRTEQQQPASGNLVATDEDRNSLTFRITAQPSKGVVEITDSSTGTFTLTPNQNAAGTDSFQFVANDGKADSNTATVAVVYGDTWSISSAEGAPRSRDSRNYSVIWTGSEMIVWGAGQAFSNMGGLYNPNTDSWRAITTSNAPAARESHTAVWSGSKMIVWGGSSGREESSGGSYDPETSLWTPTTTTGSPTARMHHTAVWTGSEMIVWGGSNSSQGVLNTGGRYDPNTNRWLPTSTAGAPTSRTLHTAVWTGSKMIVWGGISIGSNSSWLDTGGIYHPDTDSWSPMATTGAPTSRRSQTAVWTGSKMIVWGGTDSNFPLPNSGGIYDPNTNSWAPISINAACGNSPIKVAGVWSGSKMLIWGGGTGQIYDPGSDSETCLRLTVELTPSYPVGVWTGSQMIVWAGQWTTGAAGLYTP